MGNTDAFEHLDPARDATQIEKLLQDWIPLNYDVYVVGLQEATGDGVLDAIAAYTGTYRLPLNAKLYPAREDSSTQVRSRRMGRAINVQHLLDDQAEGKGPDPVVTSNDMLDRVHESFSRKFTAIGVFVSPVVAPYVRLLCVYKHGFGTLHGGQGSNIHPPTHPCRFHLCGARLCACRHCSLLTPR